MSFVRRRVRLVGGDARPIEEQTRTHRTALWQIHQSGMGPIGPNGAVKSNLTPEEKAEIEARLRAKWEYERDSGLLKKRIMRMEKKKHKGKKKKR
jgi:hypothetical protein